MLRIMSDTTRPIWTAVLALSCSFLLACGEQRTGGSSDEPSAAQFEAARAAAVAACDELGKRLLGELSAALAAGPTVDALAVCSSRAPAIGSEVRRESAVVVARTSLRVRNLDNAPDEFERTHLERWRAAELRGEPVEPVVELVSFGAAHDLRYMRPIRTVEMCSRCHGAARDLEPDVRAALTRLYPADAATGYAPGELRGAFTARVPLNR